MALSGNYPEIWIVYDKIYTLSGSRERFYKLISGTHSLFVAVSYFKQRPPKLNNGTVGKIVEVRVWESATSITTYRDISFLWRTY